MKIKLFYRYFKEIFLTFPDTTDEEVQNKSRDANSDTSRG